MPQVKLTGLSHITLAVENLERSLSFYVDLLNFTLHVKWKHGAYLTCGQLWFCLLLGEVKPSHSYTHIAFQTKTEDFETITKQLHEAGVAQWQENRSEGPSLYILDPDGYKLEIHVGTLESRLASLEQQPYEGLEWHRFSDKGE